MSLCEKMKDLRIDHDETQAEVARVLKITQQQYQLYESGKRSIPVDLLAEFCRYYGVSADYLLGLSKNAIWPR